MIAPLAMSDFWQLAILLGAYVVFAVLWYWAFSAWLRCVAPIVDDLADKVEDLAKRAPCNISKAVRYIKDEWKRGQDG